MQSFPEILNAFKKRFSMVEWFKYFGAEMCIYYTNFEEQQPWVTADAISLWILTMNRSQDILQ